MNKKRKLTIWIIAISIIITGFIFINNKLYGNPEKIEETAQILKEKLEEKYGIIILDSKGFYTHVVGYGATLTTQNGITFNAWNRPDEIVDFYAEELYNKKGLEKWGYADQYIPNIEKVHLNVGYRNEAEKDIKHFTQDIVDIKNKLLLSLYVDLKEPYNEINAKIIEEGIFNYYQQLQKDDAEGVELIVRYNENSKKQGTGSYMITRDENSRLPKISNIESVSNVFKKY